MSKNRKNVVYSTNPNFDYDNEQEEEETIENDEQRMKLVSKTLTFDCNWKRGWTIPFRRSLFFIGTVELLFARVFFGTRTHGVTKNGRKEWYAIDRVSNIINAKAIIEGQDVGAKKPMNKPCNFGFSESPKKPSSCELRTHIL